MKDSLLLRIALATSITGLVVLVLLLNTLDIKEVDISQARELGEESDVAVSGRITMIRTGEDYTLITLAREEEITVMAFDQVNLSKGQSIRIEGYTQDFKGDQEIIADKIISTE